MVDARSSVTCSLLSGRFDALGVISVIVVTASDGEKFCAVTVHVLEAFTAIDAGVQVCVSVTSPCRAKNATGR